MDVFPSQNYKQSINSFHQWEVPGAMEETNKYMRNYLDVLKLKKTNWAPKYVRNKPKGAIKRNIFLLDTFTLNN